ncbi:MAG: hypothetical protein MMC23_001991 [Stictis urceolatum]|nr:hypothetical protein [Stictis urceolata]
MPLGPAYVPPPPCTNCTHQQAIDSQGEEVNAFGACFAKHLGKSDPSYSLDDLTSTEAVDNSFFDGFLFDFDSCSTATTASPSSSSSSIVELQTHSEAPTSPFDLDFPVTGADDFSLGPAISYLDSDAHSTPFATCDDIFQEKLICSKARSIVSVKPVRQREAWQVLEAEDFTLEAKPDVVGSPDASDEQRHPIPNKLVTITQHSAADHQATEFRSNPQCTASFIDASKPKLPTSQVVRPSHIKGGDKDRSSTGTKRRRKRNTAAHVDKETHSRFLERNRNAASKCRARRKAQNGELADRCEDLQREGGELRNQQKDLLAEKATLLRQILDLGCEDSRKDLDDANIFDVDIDFDSSELDRQITNRIHDNIDMKIHRLASVVFSA